MMNGFAKLTLLSRGESYSVSLPYAYCKGLIVGTLTMELGGQVYVGILCSDLCLIGL